MTMEIIHEGNAARTKGLADFGQRELVAIVASPHLAFEAEAYLRYVTEYLRSSNAVISLLRPQFIPTLARLHS